MRRLRRRTSWVSAMPREALARWLSFGVQAGSMPKASQKRAQSASGGVSGPRWGTVTTWSRSGGSWVPTS